MCQTGCQGASIGSQPFTGLDLCTCLRLGWKDGGGITHYRVLVRVRVLCTKMPQLHSAHDVYLNKST